jgi:hypothetical protein
MLAVTPVIGYLDTLGYNALPLQHNDPDQMERGSITRHVPDFLMPLALRLRMTPFGIAYTQRRLPGVAEEFRWQLRKTVESLSRKTRSLPNGFRQTQLLQELSFTAAGADHPISILCPSRRLGNRDGNLAGMLASLLSTADDCRRVEVLVKADLDDDLFHYRRIKREFGKKLALKIIAMPRGRGAADIHFFCRDLFPYRNPLASVWFGVSDDAVFIKRGWDSDILAAAQESPSGLFIGGEEPFARVISIEGPLLAKDSPSPLYQYFTNNYSFVSFALLEACARAVSDISGWTPFGNSLCVDAFFSAVVATVWEEHGVSIYIQRDRFAERRGVASFLFDPARNAARTAALLDLMSPEHHEVRKRIAREIVSTITQRQRNTPVGGDKA